MSENGFIDDLKVLHGQLGSLSHYEILGIEATADAREIRQAFHGLAKKYHVDAHPELKEDKASRQMLQQVFAAINEAHLTLLNPKRREEYDENLNADGDVGAEVEAILIAEDHFRKAKRHHEGGRINEARLALKEALALNPEEPQYIAWHEWMRYALYEELRERNPKKADEEKERIRATLEKLCNDFDKCVDAHLFAGHCARNAGDVMRAETHYRRVCELKPKHLEATSNLRLIRNRREEKKGFLSRLLGK